MADALSDYSVQAPSADPDAQATVTDFLDYTEFFPSDLNRSLTLIGNLDETFQQDTFRVHELTKTYGGLNKLPSSDRPDPQAIRREISIALDRGLRCRESTFAEAARVYDTAEVLYKRLVGIKHKLQALPKPPSREPTPAPQSSSPELSRSRQNENDRAPRITLMVDGNRPGSRGNQANTSASASKPRTVSRRIIVPGEVLPPRDPNSPGIPVESDSESSDTPPPKRIGRPPKPPHERKTPKKIKLPKIPKEPKPHGSLGTNVHSSVAGISVSNVLAGLQQPPMNPKPGSVHAPWMKLTEWEMNKLRKRMKKNANWLPSDTMVRRELSENGRGRENMMKAKKRAEEHGEEFINEEPLPFSRLPLILAEPAVDHDDEDDDDGVENRGMRLNEAKRLKREAARAEAAAQEQLALEEAARQITNAGMAVQGLLSPNNAHVTGETLFLQTPSRTSPEEKKKSKKRKRENQSSPIVNGAGPSKDTEKPPTASTVVKKLKLSSGVAKATEDANGSATAAPAPIIAEDLPDSTAISRAETPVPAEPKGRRSKRASAAPTQAATPVPEPPPPAAPAPTEPDRPQPRSTINLVLKNKKAASVEPQPQKPPLRRASHGGIPQSKQDTPPPGKRAVQTAAALRSKRPAPDASKAQSDAELPDFMTAHRHAGRGRTKPAPGKKGAADKDDDAEEADPGPYCLCRGGDWGIMVACENRKCKIEWFHLDCVGLKGAPAPHQKWWCPDCRTALGTGEFGERLKNYSRRARSR